MKRPKQPRRKGRPEKFDRRESLRYLGFVISQLMILVIVYRMARHFELIDTLLFLVSSIISQTIFYTFKLRKAEGK